jgi:hypothetical protein
MRERENLKFDTLDLTFITNEEGKTLNAYGREQEKNGGNLGFSQVC